MADIHLKKAHALAALAGSSFKGATGISPFKGSTKSAVAGLHSAATAHAMTAKASLFKAASKTNKMKVTPGIKGSALPAAALFGGINRRKRKSKI